MLISIVIPVYNSSKYLCQCLDSIASQLYQNLEIICVNDGSKDNSLEILNEYAKKDTRISVYSKENEGKGAASARNFGLDKASGEYVIFLDADDFFEKDMVSELVKNVMKTDSDLVIYNANVYDEKVNAVTKIYSSIHLEYAPRRETFCYKDVSDKLFQMADHIVWNKMFRRSLLMDNKLRFEAIPICDDQYVPVLALVYAKKISIIDKCFVNYRVNTGSGQWDSRKLHPEVGYQASYSIVKRLKVSGIYEEVKKSYINIVMGVMRLIYDEIDDFNALQKLHYTYINEIFPMLEARDLNKEFFYDSRLYEWYCLITTNSFSNILFSSARGYGGYMTTAILRFQFPYEEVLKGSKLVLVGKGLVGRYWYSQLLLSGYAEVVAWVENENSIPKNIVCDKVIFAK